MDKPEDRGIEQFPAEKKELQSNEPPELIFFDTDGYPEEAEFIRVDDLFREEAGSAEKLTGRLSFTFIPKKDEDLIGSRMARLIQRCLLLCAVRLERPLEKVRIRPKFVQFRTELDTPDSAEKIAREFRDDLEDTVRFSRKDQSEERFWSANCFVSPVELELSDEMIIQAASSFRNQESAAGS